MKKYLCAFIAAAVLVLTGRAALAAEDWRVFPKQYDGVSIAIRTHYFPYDCDVNWRFTNRNSYPVKIEVFNKTYTTNYGNKSIADNYQTYAELKPGETKSMQGLGDQLLYSDRDFGAVLDSRSMDKNRNKRAQFVVEGLARWEYRVTRIDEASGGQGQDDRTAYVFEWKCQWCGEIVRKKFDPDPKYNEFSKEFYKANHGDAVTYSDLSSYGGGSDSDGEFRQYLLHGAGILPYIDGCPEQIDGDHSWIGTIIAAQSAP